MQKILNESIIVGLITLLLGKIVINIIYNLNADSNDIDHILKKYKNTYLIEISLFLTGMLIHLLLEYVGFNKWYCSKECANVGPIKICKTICKRKINFI